MLAFTVKLLVSLSSFVVCTTIDHTPKLRNQVCSRYVCHQRWKQYLIIQISQLMTCSKDSVEVL